MVSAKAQKVGRKWSDETQKSLSGQTLKPSEVNQKVIAASDGGNTLCLLSVIGQYIQHMNLVNVSTSIHRLAKGADKDPEVCLIVTQSPVFEELLNAIYSKLLHSQGLSCLHQSLSNVTWSLAHLYAGDSELLALLASLSSQYMDGFKPFELSMLLWGFAKLGVVDRISNTVQGLFQASSERIVANLGQFSFRSLAMITWAFATARHRDSRLFSGLASEMRRTARTANCQEIGNTVWAFASAGHRDRKLLTSMAQAAVPLMSSFKAQEISNMLWGFATLGYWNEEVFLTSIQAAMGMDLGSQHLAIILWSCAKVMPKHNAMERLVIRFAPLCTMRLGTYKPQEVSSTVQALAKVLLPDREEAPPQAIWGGAAPLHEEVLVLLEALAEWVAVNGQSFTSSAFTSVVSSLILLGRRAALSPQHDALLQDKAFLTSPWIARGAIAVLAAGLSSTVDSLPQRDLQALVQLYQAAGNRPGTSDDPSQQELSSWCLALAAGLPFLAVSHGLDEPEAIQDIPEAPSMSDSSSVISLLEDGHVGGSEHGIQTAESLPFLVAAEQGAVARAEASLAAAEQGSSAAEDLLYEREMESQELLQEAAEEAAELRRAQGRIAELGVQVQLEESMCEELEEQEMRSAGEYDRQGHEVAQELKEDERRMEEEHLRLEEELVAMELSGFRAEARLEAQLSEEQTAFGYLRRALEEESQRKEACKEELDMEISEEMTKAKEEREKYEAASRAMEESESQLGLCTAELTCIQAEQEALSTDLCSELQLRQEASVLCEEKLCQTAELRACQDRMTEELAAEEVVSKKAREAVVESAMNAETESMMEALLQGKMAGIMSNTKTSVTELRRARERLTDAHRSSSRLVLKVRSLGRQLAELDMYTSLSGEDSNDSSDEIGSTSTLTTKPTIRKLQHEMEQVLWQATAQLKMVEHEQTSWNRMTYRQREVLIQQAPAEPKEPWRSALAIDCRQNHPGASSSSNAVAAQGIPRGRLEAQLQLAAKEPLEYMPPCQVSPQAKAQLARWSRKAP